MKVRELIVHWGCESAMTLEHIQTEIDSVWYSESQLDDFYKVI